MPIIINTEDIQVSRGQGWTRLTLADAALIGAPAMATYRWVIEAGSQRTQA
jgi:hypothetical protein